MNPYLRKRFFGPPVTNCVGPSAGNFLLARFADNPDQNDRTADAADAFLKDKGIIVRRMAAYGLDDCLRITIGQEDEMRALVSALTEFFGK